MHLSEGPALDGPGGEVMGGGLQKYLAVIELSSTDSSVAVRGNLGGLLSAVQSYLLSKHF